MILWLSYNDMNMVNVVPFYLVIILDATNEFLHGDNKDIVESEQNRSNRSLKSMQSDPDTIQTSQQSTFTSHIKSCCKMAQCSI